MSNVVLGRIARTPTCNASLAVTLTVRGSTVTFTVVVLSNASGGSTPSLELVSETVGVPVVVAVLVAENVFSLVMDGVGDSVAVVVGIGVSVSVGTTVSVAVGDVVPVCESVLVLLGSAVPVVVPVGVGVPSAQQSKQSTSNALYQPSLYSLSGFASIEVKHWGEGCLAWVRRWTARSLLGLEKCFTCCLFTFELFPLARRAWRD